MATLEVAPSYPGVMIGNGGVGEIDCTVDWNSKDGVKVCSDERRMRFYKTATARIVDFEIAFSSSSMSSAMPSNSGVER